MTRKYPENRAYVLVPGRRFDRHGTRYGRGGGWYDRFLSEVPTSWLRIGVTRTQDLADGRLERKPWDQPVDWLLIEADDGWHAVETKARA